MGYIATVLAVGLLVSSASGQMPPSIEDVPPIERQADYFYYAISAGRPVEAKWHAEPTRVPFGSDVVLTLTVRYAVNPRELIQPDLRRIRGFVEQFQVLDIAPFVAREENGDTVRFFYRLRPRTLGELRVPQLLYRYYQPRFPEGKRLQPTYASSIPIIVTPPVSTPNVVAVPLNAPDHFFDYSTDENALELPPSGLTVKQTWWTQAPIPILLVAAALVGLWHMLFPSSARRLRARRNRAARRTLGRLCRSKPGDPSEVTAAVQEYLVLRWGLAACAQTPSEIEEGLAELSFPADRLRELIALWRDCDSARFGGSSDIELSLSRRAIEFIEKLEGDGK